ncbi:hypothetical protein ACFXGT_18260 [Streptomyces sp. NPDC059352]|uniref:hypothetical protein n=1 Tax=Streptomyces sp. NPDC059352 TaxID=3346810 RepID=UPI003683548C
MSSSVGAHAQPLLAKLQDLADVEHARKEQTNVAVAQAEQALADAREAQRVATERHSAATAAVTAAADYFSKLDVGTSPDDVPADSGPTQTPSQSTAAPGRPVSHLILDVLELGHITPLTSIYEGVLRLRPGTSGGAIRGSLTKLHQSGAVEIVSRGVYRLLVIPEGYEADT